MHLIIGGKQALTWNEKLLLRRQSHANHTNSLAEDICLSNKAKKTRLRKRITYTLFFKLESKNAEARAMKYRNYLLLNPQVQIRQ